MNRGSIPLISTKLMRFDVSDDLTCKEKDLIDKLSDALTKELISDIDTEVLKRIDYSLIKCFLCGGCPELKTEYVSSHTVTDIPYSMQEVYLKCNRCGFEYVDSLLSTVNLKRMFSKIGG